MSKQYITRLIAGLAAVLLVLVIPACNFSTAHISSFKVSKDKEGTQEATSFGPTDTFYARVEVSNVPSKVTLKWRIFVEKVAGQPDNAPITELDRSFDLPSDGSSTYNLSAPPAGWPAGKYRIEVGMFNEANEQKDQRSVAITVTGAAAASATAAPAATATAAAPESPPPAAAPNADPANKEGTLKN